MHYTSHGSSQNGGWAHHTNQWTKLIRKVQVASRKSAWKVACEACARQSVALLTRSCALCSCCLSSTREAHTHPRFSPVSPARPDPLTYVSDPVLADFNYFLFLILENDLLIILNVKINFKIVIVIIKFWKLYRN